MDKDINTSIVHKNPPKVDPSLYPPGFIYVEEVFTPEEQDKIISILDQHEYAHEILRRQQFYGPVYYFTPSQLSGNLQPINEQLPSDVLSTEHSAALHAYGSPKNIDSVPESSAESPPSSADHINASQYPDLPPCHSIEPLNWVIDRLISCGLFERADPREPMVDYLNDGQGHLCRITREAILNESDNNKDDISNNNPCTPQYRLKSTLLPVSSSSNDTWGHHTPEISSLYPDQILVNEYLSEHSIGSHFDDALSFGPLVVGISLGRDCILTLSRPGCIGDSISSSHHKYDTGGNILVSSSSSLNEQVDCDKQRPNKCSTTAGSICSNIDGICDIENISNTVQCRSHTELKSDRTSSEQHKCMQLSYPLSLRDWSTSDWKVGEGPQQLGHVCQCTRETLITEQLAIGKTLLRPDQYSHLIDQDDTDNNTNNNNNSQCNNDTDKQPRRHSISASQPSLSQASFHSQNTLMGGRKERYLARAFVSIRNECLKQNLPIPHNITELKQFLLRYDYSDLIKKKNISSQPKTSQSKATDNNNDSISVLKELTPSLPQINQCHRPDDVLSIHVKPGSVYVLAGASRYQYRHAIHKLPSDIIKNNPNYRRLSLTVRSLLPGRRQVMK